ncbi:MAG: hypothetical protein IKF22_03630 [Lachnospiraceae bacterium]|nr:hypothetical protein [Oscillospiraceae bacterium]MBR3170328.1 hypothetical protein [Lachnospiraceae bacterium]
MTLIGKLIKNGSVKGSIPGTGKLKGTITIEKDQKTARVGSAIVGSAIVAGS